MKEALDEKICLFALIICGAIIPLTLFFHFVYINGADVTMNQFYSLGEEAYDFIVSLKGGGGVL